MSSSTDNDLDTYSYKKLAQFESAISVDLCHQPKYCENLLDLNQNFNIKYRIPETCYIKSNRSYMIGQTILHMTLEMAQSDTFNMFMKRGADFTNVDGHGCTIVHDCTGDDFEKHLGELKRHGSIVDNGFVEMALNAHVDLNVSKNPRNRYGFSHFHIACMMNNTKAVEYFLKNNIPVDQAIDKDSPKLSGFAALHFAAKYSSYETAELLLKDGANINLKDQRGMSAFHVLVVERLKTWPAALRNKMKANLPWDNTSEYFDNNKKTLMLLLEKSRTSTFSSTDDIGFSKFKAACTLQDSSFVKQILSKINLNLNHQINLDSPVWPGYTALHFAAHFDSETFKFLLEQGADMGIRDACGTSPFDICLLSFKVSDIHSILSHHPTWKNILFSDGKTKLLDFIGAMQDANEFSSFLDENVTNINLFIPLDSPICAGYTPLHLSVIFSEKPPKSNDSQDSEYISDADFHSFQPDSETLYGSRIEKCLDLGANVTAQDARGSTPLHWAFQLQEISLAWMLLGHHPQFSNPMNNDGLSHLHIACAVKNEFMIMKLLLRNRADVNARTRAAYSWHSGYSRIVAKSGSTPLHFATEYPKILEILLECEADVLAADDEGYNPLERVLGGRLARDTWLSNYEYSEKKTKILLMLVRRLPRALVDMADAAEKLLCCYELLRSNVLKLIFESDDEVRDKILDRVGVTSFHVACIRNDVDKVRSLLLQRRGVDVDATVHEKLPMWSGLTPMLCYLNGRALREDHDSDDFTTATLLLEAGADVMKMVDGCTVVHQAFDQLSCRQMPWRRETPLKYYKNHVSLIKLLLSHHKDFSENPTTISGLSHLHIACACNDVKMVEELLKNGADVDRQIDYFCPLYGGDTPLHIAAIYKCTRIVELLLKHGANVHSTNNYDSTPLHIAAYARFGIDLKILKALLSAGANVNAVNIIGATPLELMLEHLNFTKSQVDVLLKSASYVHSINPVTKQGCLALAVKTNQTFNFVYKMFVGSAETKKLDEMNRNAIHNVVSLARPSHNDINDDAVDEAFPPVEDYSKAIKTLIRLNLNVDQQDLQGKTPLHYAVQMQNVTAVLGLLNNGADFNITDESGKTPFAYSFQNTIEGTFDEDYVELDKRIMQIFATHATKLALLDLDVDESNRKLKKRTLTEHSISITNKDEICSEFANLRCEEKIESCCVGLNDFLCETGAVVTLSRLPLEERRVVDQFFNKAASLRRKYPKYAGILNLQYRKALERVKFVPLALLSVNVVMGFNVPVVCSDIILQFLSNDSLKNLIAAANVK